MACRMRRCHECNFPLGKKDVFCPRCGARQRREKANPAIIALTGGAAALWDSIQISSRHD